MFNNLNAEMARKKISIKALAEATGINYESLKNKMSGTTEFKRSEMVRIKKSFELFFRLSVRHRGRVEKCIPMEGGEKRCHILVNRYLLKRIKPR